MLSNGEERHTKPINNPHFFSFLCMNISQVCVIFTVNCSTKTEQHRGKGLRSSSSCVMNVGHEKVEHMNSPNGVKLITSESLSDSLLPSATMLPLNLNIHTLWHILFEKIQRKNSNWK